MERNLIYLNNCAVLPNGKNNSFLMQEARWLTEHFERTFVVSHTGFSNLNRDGVELPLARTGLDKLRPFIWTTQSGQLPRRSYAEGKVKAVAVWNEYPVRVSRRHRRPAAQRSRRQP